jgi:hypothetical protein
MTLQPWLIGSSLVCYTNVDINSAYDVTVPCSLHVVRVYVVGLLSECLKTSQYVISMP